MTKIRPWRKRIGHMLAAFCGVLSLGNSANAEIISINPNPDAPAENICTFWPQNNETRTGDITRTNKTKMCQSAIVQDRNNSDAELYAKIDEIHRGCDYRNEVAEARGPEGRAKILDLRKTWSVEDMGTIVRYVKRCDEKLSRQANVERALANHAWMLTTDRVYDSFGKEYIAKVRGAEQMRDWVVQQQENQLQQDQHRQRLSDLGYRQISLLDLKVQASKILDTMVAVTGQIYAPSNELAIMVKDEHDINPVGLDMRQASDETRRRILSRCSNVNARCRFEVRGKLVRSSPPVIQLD